MKRNVWYYSIALTIYSIGAFTHSALIKQAPKALQKREQKQVIVPSVRIAGVRSRILSHGPIIANKPTVAPVTLSTSVEHYSLEQPYHSADVQALIDLFNKAVQNKTPYFDDATNKKVSLYLSKLTLAELRLRLKITEDGKELKGQTFLQLIIGFAGAQQVEQLLAKVSAQDASYLYVQDGDGRNALHVAVGSLIATFQDFSYKDVENYVGIIRAIIKVLLKYDTENRLVSAVDIWNNTPLLYFLGGCSKMTVDQISEIAAMLIGKMSVEDLKKQSKDSKYNALMIAAYYGWIEVMQLLLDKMLPSDKDCVNSVGAYNLTAALIFVSRVYDAHRAFTSEEENIVCRLINAMSAESLNITPVNYLPFVDQVVFSTSSVALVLGKCLLRLIKVTNDVNFNFQQKGFPSIGCGVAHILCSEMIDDQIAGDLLSAVTERVSDNDLIQTESPLNQSQYSLIDELLNYALNPTLSQSAVAIRLKIAQQIMARMVTLDQKVIDAVCKQSLTANPAVVRFYNPTFTFNLLVSLYAQSNMSSASKTFVRNMYTQWYNKINTTAVGQKFLKVNRIAPNIGSMIQGVEQQPSLVNQLVTLLNRAPGLLTSAQVQQALQIITSATVEELMHPSLSDGFTILHIAAAQPYPQILQALLAKLKDDSQFLSLLYAQEDKQKSTVLEWLLLSAALAPHYNKLYEQMALDLLKYDADKKLPNIVNIYTSSPLELVLTNSRFSDFTLLPLQLAQDTSCQIIMARDWWSSPLLKAIHISIPVAQALLNNLLDTQLSGQEKKRVVQFLNSLFRNNKEGFGVNLLHYGLNQSVTSEREKFILTLLPSMSVDNIKLAGGAQKLTPLMLAVNWKYQKVVEALLKRLKPEDLNKQNSSGDTALVLGEQRLNLGADSDCQMLLTVARAMNSEGITLFNSQQQCALLIASNSIGFSNTGFLNLFAYLVKNSNLTTLVPSVSLPLSVVIANLFLNVSFAGLNQWQVAQLESLYTAMNIKDFYSAQPLSASSLYGSFQSNVSFSSIVLNGLANVTDAVVFDHLVTLAEKIAQRMISDVTPEYFDQICKQSIAIENANNNGTTYKGPLFDLVSDVLSPLTLPPSVSSPVQQQRVTNMIKLWTARIKKSTYGVQILALANM